MNLFDVYPLNDVTIVKAKGSYVWDDKGEQYLDMYGGHAVISIGHTHPYWVKQIEEQLEKIAFYSNSVRIPLQQQLADKLSNQTANLVDMQPLLYRYLFRNDDRGLVESP